MYIIKGIWHLGADFSNKPTGTYINRERQRERQADTHIRTQTHIQQTHTYGRAYIYIISIIYFIYIYIIEIIYKIIKFFRNLNINCRTKTAQDLVAPQEKRRHVSGIKMIG